MHTHAWQHGASHPPHVYCPEQKWINGVGKAQKRKGKRLFMPMRIALTGRMQGPDVGDQLATLLLDEAGSEVGWLRHESCGGGCGLPTFM